MTWSRRSFLKSALVLPVGTAAPRRLWSLAALTGTVARPLFPKPDLIRYDSDCFTIRGADTFIFSMECPYPRVRPELWRDRLLKVRQAGFNTIDSYVFCNYHERKAGEFDFTELEQFLQLAREFGFWVIVRPGPMWMPNSNAVGSRPMS
jgi:hypothetical protein